MLDRLRYAFKISRFRFWIYTGGTYVVGYALGAGEMADFFALDYYVYLIYFFFFANVFIYGVNDLFDMSTDEKNPKKEEKEEKLEEGKISDLKWILYFTLALSLILLVFQSDWTARIAFISFLFLSYFYSAEPLRFKSIPILDFSSNMLYIVPGIFGFYLAAGELPPILYMIAGFAHISAMHVFSAVPDIKYDRSAGIDTTAVALGKKRSLALCISFWSLLAVLTVYLAGFHPLSFIIFIYPIVPSLVLLRDDIRIEKAYWVLPYINTSLGGLLFVSLLYYNIL